MWCHNMLKISVIHCRSLTVPEPISDIRAAAGLQKLKNARKIGQNTLYAQNFLCETITLFNRKWTEKREKTLFALKCAHKNVIRSEKKPQKTLNSKSLEKRCTLLFSLKKR